jgi:hypothetical protein
LQLGAIIAAEPKKPAFKHGGIVGLPETYDTRYANGGIVQGNGFRGVDSVSLTAAPGEMITNEEQQGNLWAVAQRGIEAIEGGGGRGTLINNIYLDGVLIATNSVEHINNGQTGQIEWRMIRQ